MDCSDAGPPKPPCSPDDLSEFQAAVIYMQVGIIVERLEDADVSTKKAAASVPRGTVTCAEAWQFFPLLMVLLQQKFPQLADPEALSELLQSAYTDSASGRPN